MTKTLNWDQMSDPQEILEGIGEEMSTRKLRLFAVACCRKVAKLLDMNFWDALSVAELHADGLLSEKAMTQSLLRAFEKANRDVEVDSPSQYAMLSVHAALFSRDNEQLYFSEDHVAAVHPCLIPYSPDSFAEPWGSALQASMHAAAAEAARTRGNPSFRDEESALGVAFRDQVSLLQKMTGGNVPPDVLESFSTAGQTIPALRVYAALAYSGAMIDDFAFRPRFLEVPGLIRPESLPAPTRKVWDHIWHHLEQYFLRDTQPRKGSWDLDRLLGFE